jgi:hypothetical protein
MKRGMSKYDKIYLQLYGADKSDPDYDGSEADDICWCSTQVYDTDVAYVRREVAVELLAAIRVARGALVSISDSLGNGHPADFTDAIAIDAMQTLNTVIAKAEDV